MPRFAILMNGFFNAMFLARYAVDQAGERERERELPNWPRKSRATAGPAPAAAPPLPTAAPHRQL